MTAAERTPARLVAVAAITARQQGLPVTVEELAEDADVLEVVRLLAAVCGDLLDKVYADRARVISAHSEQQQPGAAMTLSKEQLVAHLLDRHDRRYFHATRSGKAAIEKEHRAFHAAGDCDHRHDWETGRIAPATAAQPGTAP